MDEPMVLSSPMPLQIVVDDLVDELCGENHRLLDALTVSREAVQLAGDYRKCLTDAQTQYGFEDYRETIGQLNVKYESLQRDIEAKMRPIGDNYRLIVSVNTNDDHNDSIGGDSSNRKTKSSKQQVIRLGSDSDSDYTPVGEAANVEVSERQDPDRDQMDNENETQMKANVKFLAADGDELLEEDGLIVTRRDPKNDSILVVQLNDSTGHTLGYRCNWSDCPFVSVNRAKACDHLKSVHSHTGLFKCQKCNKQFMSQKLMTGHVKDKHSNHLRCDYPDCDYQTPLRKRLNEHLRRHKGLKPYPCGYDGCDKRFTTRQELRRHNNSVHLGHRTVCEWPGCGLIFKNNKALDNHKAIHLDT